MKDLFLVASFTFKDLVKRKSFIISNIIILLIIVLGFNVPNIIKNISSGDENFGKDKITIVDNENIYEGTLEALASEDLGYQIEVSKEQISIEKLKEKIKNGDIQEALYIETKEGIINIQYVIESEALGTYVPQELIMILQSTYQNLQISKLGVTNEELAIINMPFSSELVQVEESKTGNSILPMMLLSIVLFYAIYFFAYQVSSSITTEKTSKIIETLVTSTSPKTIVIGKTIGIGLAGVLQTIVTVVVALISAKLFLDSELIDMILSSINLTPTVAIITIIYYILGYSLFALLYALTGSTVAKPEDVQSANGPVAILAVIGFYLSYFTMMNPASSLNKIAALVPISSPFCMPFRVMMGLAGTSEILISLGILGLTILIVARISIKIYSSAILNYGSKINLKDMFKMYKNKND
ncbi:MAG: ABC transporter permease [Clostridia bacterium]|nr:ABC transporter permease [Clostridia bacterium]